MWYALTWLVSMEMNCGGLIEPIGLSAEGGCTVTVDGAVDSTRTLLLTRREIIPTQVIGPGRGRGDVVLPVERCLRAFMGTAIISIPDRRPAHPSDPTRTAAGTWLPFSSIHRPRKKHFFSASTGSSLITLDTSRPKAALSRGPASPSMAFGSTQTTFSHTYIP